VPGRDDTQASDVSRRSLLTDLVRYGIGSAISLLTILAVSSLLHEVVGLDEALAVSVAFAASLVVNYAVLRVYVFPGQTAPVGRQFAQTVATSVAFRGIEYLMFLGLHLLLGIHYLIATTTVVFISAAAKFIVYRHVVFARRHEPRGTNDPTRARSRMGSQYSGLLSPYLCSRRIEVAAPHLRGRILDIGCASGVLAERISADRYLGVDIDSGAIEKARASHPDHRFEYVADLADDELFDTVVALAVIEHVPDPPAWVRWAVGHLDDKGKIIVTTPHARWEPVHSLAAKIRLTSPEASYEHETTFDRSTITALFELHGFRVERYQRFLAGMNQLIVASRGADCEVSG
jgi:2-polyprenyl-3-methyl-5-hydroxy-6-metoxy-1,4-benzoquinol methylase/putative flippase GtrA